MYKLLVLYSFLFLSFVGNNYSMLAVQDPVIAVASPRDLPPALIDSLRENYRVWLLVGRQINDMDPTIEATQIAYENWEVEGIVLRDALQKAGMQKLVKNIESTINVVKRYLQARQRIVFSPVRRNLFGN